MPIYAYRCTSCGHAKDVLQKISDPLLTDCPACGAATFSKQVTAAGFQLKGSGWYVTDFREKPGGAKKGEGGEDAKADPAKADGAADASGAKPADAKSDAKTEAKPEASTSDSKAAAAAPAASPSASPAPAPSAASAPAAPAASK